LDRLSNGSEFDNGKHGQEYWKGKKIIPLGQWIKMGGGISMLPILKQQKKLYNVSLTISHD
jgi:hypothetical protein